MKIEKIIEIANWIVIFISPVLIGAILGIIVALWLGGILGMFVGIVIFLIGILLGVIFAEKARRKFGTNKFMTSLFSTTSKRRKEYNQNNQNP